MKIVNVYEIKETQRVLQAGFDQIPVHEMYSQKGEPLWRDPEEWGGLPAGPGFTEGGPLFIRYQLPVTETFERWVVDGQQHERRAYVAISRELLEKLGPAVNRQLSDLAANRQREIEDLLRGQKANLAALQRARDELENWHRECDRYAYEISVRDQRIGNFLGANVITRIWRAIRGQL